MSDNGDRECYLVADDGYCHGPYANEARARLWLEPGDEIRWLHRHEIDEFKKIVS